MRDTTSASSIGPAPASCTLSVEFADSSGLKSSVLEWDVFPRTSNVPSNHCFAVKTCMYFNQEILFGKASREFLILSIPSVVHFNLPFLQILTF